MATYQPGILASPPPHARYLSFRVKPTDELGSTLSALAQACDGEDVVVGIGEPVIKALGRSVPGLRSFPRLVGPGVSVPSTQLGLWCWLRGDDPGTLLHRGRALEDLVAPAFERDEVTEGFMHREGRDLTGYVDGTENPEGEDASRTAAPLEAAERFGNVDRICFIRSDARNAACASGT